MMPDDEKQLMLDLFGDLAGHLVAAMKKRDEIYRENCSRYWYMAQRDFLAELEGVE